MLHLAIAWYANRPLSLCRLEMVELLVAAGHSVAGQTEDGETPIILQLGTTNTQRFALCWKQKRDRLH
jgi:hypothetical protein